MGLKTMMGSLLRRPDGATSKEQNPAPKPQFPAVSIKPGRPACDAAKAMAEQRVLSRSAVPLPLPDCTMTDECKCAFAKHSDRRDEDDRRVFGWDGTHNWHGDSNRRKSRGRRDHDI